MKKLLIVLFSLGLVGLVDALVISNSAVSSLTPTSAVVYVQVVSTNGTGTNPTLTCYYDITDRGTNYAIYSYTNLYGTAGIGGWAVSNQNLSAATKYYFRWRGVEGTNIALTTPSSNWWTKASVPTAVPPSGAYGNVSVRTNDAVLKYPTNFFGGNSNLIKNAIGADGYLTSETDPVFTNWLGTNSYVQAETDSIATNLVYITSNAYVAADGLKANDSALVVVSNIAGGLNGQSSTWAKASTDAAAATNETAALRASTNTLDTLVINLNVATGTLNTAVGNLNTSTQTLNTATGALQTAIGNLRTSTTTLNTAVGNLQTATGTLNIAVGELKDKTNLWNASLTGATMAAGSADAVTVTGPNAAITWNTNAAGGGAGNAASWSAYPATQSVNMGLQSLTNISVIKATGGGGDDHGMAVGGGAVISGARSVAIGRNAVASGTASMVLGGYGSSSNNYSIVISADDNYGRGSRGDKSVAIYGQGGILLAGPVDGMGYIISNASFIGNGAGLTNVIGTETNSFSMIAGTNMQFRVSGTNVYADAIPSEQLFYFDSTHRIAVTNVNFSIQYYTGGIWSNVAIFIP